MSEVDKIAKLLYTDSIEKQIAAAIVLGELRAKGPEIVAGLMHALDSGVNLLQRHALEALARVGAKKALPQIFPLLSARDADVRHAAAEAVASVGEDVVPTIRGRMATATTEERRALDVILAELGGKDAFSTLLAGLASGEGESAKNAAIAMRDRIKTADGNKRRSYLAETEKFLKGGGKKGVGAASATATAAAIKILGYLEDDKAMPTLVAYASDKKQSPNVRQEALIALRFALGKKTDAPRVVEMLVEAAGDDDRTLAHTALHTLGSLDLPSGMSKRLEKLVGHSDPDRARFVIEQLGRQGDADAARILIKVLTSSDRKRAELAAAALAGKDEAVPLLAKALLDSTDVDRGWLIRNVLRPSAKKVTPAVRKQLLETAIERFGAGERGWESLLDIVRDADPDAVATALRTLAQKLKKADNKDKAAAVLALLCRTDRATDEDRYTLATLELGKSAKDTRPASRASDEALRQLGALIKRGYDVVAALKKDRGVELEDMFYVGFHLVEEGHPAGDEILEEVVKKGGRSKIAKMAKNKLSLASG
jgi:HEAT repeat protein